MEQETNDLIKSEIENNDVCLFMKGTPDACLLYTSPSPRD